MFSHFPVLFLLVATASAQSTSALVDINQVTSPASGMGHSSGSVESGGVTYFVAETLAEGLELWRTTGPAGSTSLVADLWPGPDSSSPRDLVAHAGLVYFTAEGRTVGRELWSTDGTAAGTTLVKDIEPGPTGSDPRELLSFGGQLVFGATTAAHGAELWSSDGTAAGTNLLADILPGVGSSDATDFSTGAGGALFFFQANSLASGVEPWSSDGTAAGTKLLRDISPSGSYPSAFGHVGAWTLFMANDGTHGIELWRTDGTTAGTQLVVDIAPGPASAISVSVKDAPVELGGFAYFQANDGVTGYELWRTDGTASGTSLVGDLALGSLPSQPRELTVLGNRLLFGAKSTDGAGSYIGRELHALDATTGAIQLVHEFITGVGGGNPIRLLESGGLVYFAAQTVGLGEELWASDGTAAGTVLMGDLLPGGATSGPAELGKLAGGGVIFSAQTDALGRELFASLGTPLTTGLLADIEPASPTQDANPTSLAAIAGTTLYFSANDGVHGAEPFRWDPLQGLVSLGNLKGDLSTVKDSHAKEFTQVWLGGKPYVIFSANGESVGREPYLTDGTAAGTVMLKDIHSSWVGSNPEGFTAALGKVFFSARGVDVQPWVSDGTAAGTVMLKQLGHLGLDSNPHDFTQIGYKVLFSATKGTDQTELYQTDGTPAGTSLFLDIHGSSSSSSPSELTRIGDQIAFQVRRAVQGSGSELWATNGTVGGTKLVSQLSPSFGAGPRGEFLVLNGELYFNGFDGSNYALWRSDLTSSGTVLVAQFGSEPIQQLTRSNGRLFFSVSGELNVFDTVTGNMLQLTAPPLGIGRTNPLSITAANGGVFFAPDYSYVLEDKELMFSDGTVAGTVVVANIAPGLTTKPWGGMVPTGSRPRSLSLVGGDLIFPASEALSIGRELWRLSPAGAYVQDLGLSGNGHTLSASQPKLGSPVTIRGENASASERSFLLLGVPLQTPVGMFAEPGSSAWLDPTSAILMTITHNTSWQLAVPIPAEPALAGLQLAVQSWTPDPTASFASTSNGLFLVLGN